MKSMSLAQRARRHLAITRTNYGKAPSPPFLILFINSQCNMKCDHCFYWRALNQRDDLTRDELVALSRSLGKIENLNLSGGEPFLRKEFAEICAQFIAHNGVEQIYVPSNGWYTEKTIRQVRETLKSKSLRMFVVELSLDGMPEFHDGFRGLPGAFERAMQTYDALAELQKEDGRLRIHAISTATQINIDEIRRLTTFLYERCPAMDHHNLAMIRGDRKDATLTGPLMAAYEDLYAYLRRLWAPREANRYGAVVEPMLQWAKGRTAAEQRQVVPCRAGVLSGVVYANGDVSVCETRAPLGNLRNNSFGEIWRSPEAERQRASIAASQCYCTNEIFLWPSVVYQPVQLAKAMIGAKLWRQATPLTPGERAALAGERSPETA